jgi:hypothetical protein
VPLIKIVARRRCVTVTRFARKAFVVIVPETEWRKAALARSWMRNLFAAAAWFG